MAYEIAPRDNHSWMVGSCNRLDPESGCPACPACGFRTDDDHTNPRFQHRQKRYDISCCYDGAIIVSGRFKALCESLGATRIRFVPLSAAPGHFHLKCLEPVALDYEAMKCQFDAQCIACGRFRQRCGGGPSILALGAELAEHEAALSDETLGSNNESIPRILVGTAFIEAYRRERLTGICGIEPALRSEAHRPLAR